MADDHTLFLQGITKLLESEIDIVGTVQDGRALLEAVERLKPDIALLDITMPMLNGLDAARQLKKAHPSLLIVFLTMHMNPAYVSEAFRAGASAYLLKGCEASELSTALREVLQGRSYVTPLVTRDTLDLLLRPESKRTSSPPAAKLTARQREVLQLIAEGKSSKEVAQLLNIAVRTVEFHKARLMQELGAHNRTELIKYAIASGITSL
jgi:DNA-binding NarL/FixJ family response regulator